MLLPVKSLASSGEVMLQFATIYSTLENKSAADLILCATHFISKNPVHFKNDFSL
jgi:hypothetical protein